MDVYIPPHPFPLIAGVLARMERRLDYLGGDLSFFAGIIMSSYYTF